MIKNLLFLICLTGINNTVISQGFFISNATGDWNSPSSWTLASGNTTTNYPIAGDSVIIQNEHSIQVVNNSQCQSLSLTGGSLLTNTNNASVLKIANNLLVTETSVVSINAGLLTVTGNLTINQKSTLVQNGGAVSIVGLVFITSPSASAGNTTLNIGAGVFSCVGGITITATTLPAGRNAEMKIGNSAVNVVGALTTISSNSKITFTGIGALTLAGVITIPNPLSFNAGNGRVIYVGIPGANQSIAALTYSNLVITGIGSGSKIISGNVAVTDSLTLLSDTLLVDGTGSLSLNNNTTIVRTAGKIIATPTFLGVVDILYNNVQRDTTGAEIPVANGVLRNLTVNNIAGVKLGNNIAVSNKITLKNGELFTDDFILSINNPLGGTTVDPAVERTNGYIRGKINRAIGTSTGVRIFPFGIGLLQGYREFKLDYTTAPTNAGTISAQHFNSAPTAQSGLPLTDGTTVLAAAQPFYWQADALNGLAGGTYNLMLTADGCTGISDINMLRIIKRPSAGGSWVLNGKAGTNSGTNTAPVVMQNEMSNFSQFAIGYPSALLPLTLLNFTATQKNEQVILHWKTSNEKNIAYFSIEKSNNGINFVEKGKVSAVVFSANENIYQYPEIITSPGKYYYRLKILNKDGSFTFSSIIAVNLQKPSTLIVYPTITANRVYIAYSNKEDLQLYNSAGQFVLKMTNGSNDISALNAGLYILKAGNKLAKIFKQ